MKTPIQNIIPKNVADEYKMRQDAKKKKQTAYLYGGRNYGKTILRDLLIKDFQS